MTRNFQTLEEPNHQTIEVVSCKLRVKVPDSFHNTRMANLLANKVASKLDAEQVVVMDKGIVKIEMFVEFTLRDTVPDHSNLVAIRNEVEDIVKRIVNDAKGH